MARKTQTGDTEKALASFLAKSSPGTITLHAELAWKEVLQAEPCDPAASEGGGALKPPSRVRWGTTSTCLALAAAVAACAGDPAKFRPARNARDYPSVKNAYRVRQVGPECEKIGVVHAEGDSTIDKIATTAANHGGTHYIIREDDTEVVGYETTGGAWRLTDDLMLGRSSTTLVKDRWTWAVVYRCLAE